MLTIKSLYPNNAIKTDAKCHWVCAAGLGFGRREIMATIQTMLPNHFYKSMTSNADHRVWQDVYHVPSEVGALYVKFTADVLTSFLLLSFKEKEN